MGDSNNRFAGSLSPEPDPALKALEPMVGAWRVSGTLVDGSPIGGDVRFEWMTGRFFLIQHVNITAAGRLIQGVEYIGFDPDTGTLRSTYFDAQGSKFTYTWEIVDDEIRIWFGERGSGNRFEGRSQTHRRVTA